MSFFKVIMYRHVLSTRVSGKGTKEKILSTELCKAMKKLKAMFTLNIF